MDDGDDGVRRFERKEDANPIARLSASVAMLVGDNFPYFMAKKYPQKEGMMFKLILVKL
jgi:hypothetical protein